MTRGVDLFQTYKLPKATKEKTKDKTNSVLANLPPNTPDTITQVTIATGDAIADGAIAGGVIADYTMADDVIAGDIMQSLFINILIANCNH